jgi:endonuclease/exonuclease/phosphatase family metal-dependent hydrolase
VSIAILGDAAAPEPGAQTAPAPTLRVMTWNIHGGIGPDGRFDLARVVATIIRHDPDVVAIQEVDSRRRAAGDPPPFAFLKEAVGHHGIEAKSITTADGDYGQMLISKCPFENTLIHDFTVKGREPRRAIETEVAAEHGRLRVIASHFGLSFSERREQARRIVEIARRHPTATVMLGDFNDWAWPSSLRGALKRELPARTRHASFPSWYPLLRLDRIYCWPQDALVHSFTDRTARLCSDHLPVIADVRLSPA